MRAAFSRALVAVAAACLGERRREWARAMEAELDAACEHGRPLPFALGCLAAAVRELPAHQEGRFALARHALAFALILPLAALLASSVLAGFPGAGLGDGGTSLVDEGNRFAVAPLAALLAFLAAAHLRLAWLLLERDWDRVASAAALVAAATATLFLFSTLVFGHPPALIQAAALAGELAGLSALARWDAGPAGGWPEAPA